jgi:hypothetical protein
MKKSYKLIIQDIQEVLSSFVPTDDVLQRFDEDVIGSKLQDIRLTVMNDDFKERKKLLEGWYSRTCCHEILCRDVNCTILGGVPALMKEYYLDFNDVNINRDLPGSIKFLIVPTKEPYTITFQEYEMYLAQDNAAYSRNMPVFTVIEDSDAGLIAPIKNLPTLGLKYVCIYAINNAPNQECEFDEDATYPIPGILVHKVEYLTIKHFLAAMGIPVDMINDANDLRQLQQQRQQPQE